MKKQTTAPASTGQKQKTLVRVNNSRSPDYLPGSIHFQQRYLGNGHLQSTPQITMQRKRCDGFGGGTCPYCKQKKELAQQVQPKLTIGPADDGYEREADRVADQIMRMPESAVQGEYVQSVAKPHTPPLIQRAPEESETTSAITAQDIFPFPEGSRLLLIRAMPDKFFDILNSFEKTKQAAATMQVFDAQEANVTTASADLFEASIPGPVTIPAANDSQAQTLSDITLSVHRSGETFDLSLSARAGNDTGQQRLGAISGISARREQGGIVLTIPTGEASQPQLLVSTGEQGSVRISAITASVLGPLAGVLPESIDVIDLNRLPDAATDSQVQQAVEAIVERQARRRRTRRQGFSFGMGVQFGSQARLLSTLGWQIRFPVKRLPPGIWQIPLEMQIQYAPVSSVIGALSSGVSAQVPTKVPVNIRLIAGVAGGRLEEPAEDGPKGRGAFGPTLGVGAGVELGRFRANIRYEHLFNLIENSPNLHSLSATAGITF